MRTRPGFGWTHLLFAAALAFGAQAQAQSNKVTLVVPYPPGGAADQMARVIAQGMHERHGQHRSEHISGISADGKNAQPCPLGTAGNLAGKACSFGVKERCPRAAERNGGKDGPV